MTSSTRVLATSIVTLTLSFVGSGMAQEDDIAKDGSYVFGTQVAKQFTLEDIDLEAFMEGFKDQLEKKDLRLSGEEAQEIFRSWQQQVMADQKKRAVGDAEAFLEENGKKEGVVTTESGLQYTIIKEGSGKTPKATDRVKAHYHGTLIDGTVFDSSKERGKPFETAANRVIRGWQEGLQLMKEGATYRFFIHPDLAYGGRSQGKIPAYSVLIFDLELIEVLGGKKPVQAVTPPIAIPPLNKDKK